MQEARRRDVKCRFPECTCHPWLHSARPLPDRIYEVSHQVHRGMGGDPTGERSDPALLLLVCRWRHRLSKFSIDRGTLKWKGLTDAGANGPIRWLIKALDLPVTLLPGPDPDLGLVVDGWFELARETAPHEYEPFSEAQAAMLQWLATMEQ